MVQAHKISVLIPAYNVSPWLRRCLDSVAVQTYGNTEILIYDDGSTDATTDICKEYAAQDERIRLIGRQRVGIAEARNRLLRAASGFAVVFVDSDDWIEPNFVETLLTYLLNDNLDFCGCSICYEQGDNKKNLLATSKKTYSIYDKPQIIKQYLELTPLHGSLCNKLIRTELIMNLTFNADWNYAEDSSFVWNLIKRIGKAGLTDRVLYHYEAHEGSLSDWKFNESQLVLIKSWQNILRDVAMDYPRFFDTALLSFLQLNLSILFSIVKNGIDDAAIVAPIVRRIRKIRLPLRYIIRLDVRYIFFYLSVCVSYKQSRKLYHIWKCWKRC